MSVRAFSPKLVSPPQRDSAPAHLSESHHLVRERTFPAATDLEEILHSLHATRASGQLIVDVTQGSVGTVRFSERRKVFPETK